MNLSKDFLLELLKTCFRNKEILDIAYHHLEYHYLPSEPYKDVWKEIRDFYILNDNCPSFGYISQRLTDLKKEEALNLLVKVKEASIPDLKYLINQFEEFLINIITIDSLQEIVTLFNTNKKDEARTKLLEKSKKIENFTLAKGSNFFESLFGGFVQRQELRKIEAGDLGLRKKTHRGIDQIDDLTFGGLPETDMDLFIFPSGYGKTTYLRWRSQYNARLGFKVLYVNLEGSKQDNEEGHDAVLTGRTLFDVERGNLSDKFVDEINNSLQYLLNNIGGDVIYTSVEQFGEYYLHDLEKDIQRFIKVHGQSPDEIDLDYFEALEIKGKYDKNTIQGEKARRTALAKGLKNLCVKYKTRLATCTQASDVSIDKLNTADSVLTRNDLSANKALLNEFSFLFSFNQTSDEYDEGRARIFCDKARKSKRGWTVQIYQDLEHLKFYDRFKTLTTLYQRGDFII